MAVPGEHLIMKRRKEEAHQKVYMDVMAKQMSYKVHHPATAPTAPLTPYSQATCDFEVGGIKKSLSNAVQVCMTAEVTCPGAVY